MVLYSSFLVSWKFSLVDSSCSSAFWTALFVCRLLKIGTLRVRLLVDQRFGIAREWINATDMRALEKRLCLREELKAFSVRVKLTGPAEDEGGADLPGDVEDDSWQRELVAALPKMHAIGLLRL